MPRLFSPLRLSLGNGEEDPKKVINEFLVGRGAEAQIDQPGAVLFQLVHPSVLHKELEGLAIAQYGYRHGDLLGVGSSPILEQTGSLPRRPSVNMPSSEGGPQGPTHLKDRMDVETDVDIGVRVPEADATEVVRFVPKVQRGKDARRRNLAARWPG